MTPSRSAPAPAVRAGDESCCVPKRAALCRTCLAMIAMCGRNVTIAHPMPKCAIARPVVRISRKDVEKRRPSRAVELNFDSIALKVI
jgi:hypothetical protein